MFVDMLLSDKRLEEGAARPFDSRIRDGAGFAETAPEQGLGVLPGVGAIGGQMPGIAKAVGEISGQQLLSGQGLLVASFIS